MVKTYVSKPVEIQAIQYTCDNFDEIRRFTNLICDLLGSLKPYNPPDIYIDFGGYYKVIEIVPTKGIANEDIVKLKYFHLED